MKFNKILLASLSACMFAACSNNEDIPNPTDAIYDAAINLAVAPSANTPEVKASTAGTDEAGTLQEQAVKRLTAYLFDSTGKFVTLSDTSVTTGNLDRIGRMIVKVPETGTSSFQMYVVANGEAPISVANVDAFKAAKATLDKENDNTMTMASTLITVSGVVGVKSGVQENYYTGGTGASTTSQTEPANWNNNYTGAKVDLYRLAARVQLESLKTAFTAQYVDSTFVLDNVSLINVESKSTLAAGTTAWWDGASYWNGIDKNSTVGNLMANTFTLQPSYAKAYTGVSIKNTTPVTFDDLNKFKCYIYENPNAETRTVNATDNTGKTFNTRLIIAGHFTTSPNHTRYYAITIKDVTAQYVNRNTIYKISATITGEGSDDPNIPSLANAGINAQVTVAPWKVINQTEDDVN